jgi:hypothetical protein
MIQSLIMVASFHYHFVITAFLIVLKITFNHPFNNYFAHFVFIFYFPSISVFCIKNFFFVCT